MVQQLLHKSTNQGMKGGSIRSSRSFQRGGVTDGIEDIYTQRDSLIQVGCKRGIAETVEY